MWEIFLKIPSWWKSVKAENQWINGIAFQNWRGKNYVSEQQRIWGPSLQTYSANFCNNSCRILILSYSRFYNSDSELFSTENLWEFKNSDRAKPWFRFRNQTKPSSFGFDRNRLVLRNPLTKPFLSQKLRFSKNQKYFWASI